MFDSNRELHITQLVLSRYILTSVMYVCMFGSNLPGQGEFAYGTIIKFLSNTKKKIVHICTYMFVTYTEFYK